jgi:hypothetical protein
LVPPKTLQPFDGQPKNRKLWAVCSFTPQVNPCFTHRIFEGRIVKVAQDFKRKDLHSHYFYCVPRQVLDIRNTDAYYKPSKVPLPRTYAALVHYILLKCVEGDSGYHWVFGGSRVGVVCDSCSSRCLDTGHVGRRSSVISG